MARTADITFTEFEQYLREHKNLGFSTLAGYPSGVRWVFKHFNGEWPPNGVAVQQALHSAGLAPVTVSTYRSAWAAYLDFLAFQGHDVGLYRIPVRSSAARSSFTAREATAIRDLVHACQGCSMIILAALRWPQVKIHRDYIMLVGTKRNLAFDPTTHFESFAVLARWGLRLPGADDSEILDAIRASDAPVIPRVPGSNDPVEVVTLRRWLAKYA